MSVVKINAIHVPEGKGPELEQRFAARAHAVDGQPGFEGFQLLRPVKGDDRYFVVTTWATEGDYRNWRDGKAGEHHGGDRRPVATGADLLEFETVEF
ncbi:antibiotic biosynthesis monooxygenase family protein [Pseudarthrobacter enclensis]|jgi:heme-degrading monooxygenase HmoA|uniref:Heme-degrading monooxygenase HmoA n=1 Tax=Pseudarthrobacter enclensis TaxID=993070 RepID=A0ABT9RTN0_9MICC|nr:antibiotic biosynthesis monooxygenase [Pseudarthrobacter enclensis]MDP9888598.1 heme-degrading monooxygenase HmoA [Pseudarthrobacter enclensis]